MAKKNKNKRVDIVYSTNPDFDYEYDEKDEQQTPNPAQQKLRVMLDRKQRKGKEVTLVTGFMGSSDDLKELGKKLKSKCGAGGTVKEGEILVQGNFKEKIHELLLDMGYSNTKISGG